MSGLSCAFEDVKVRDGLGSGFSLGLSLNALGQSPASRKCKGLQVLGLPVAITKNCYFQHAF